MRILAAMSGGVDSSVAAAILVGEGHEVIGVSLHLADESLGGKVSRCCSASDLRDARLVAGALRIPYYVLNEEEAFAREVLDPFLSEYARGRTPNPCVRCNSTLKFGRLLRIARSLDASHVATGHYARIERRPPSHQPRLHRAADVSKDQSYFLFDLSGDQLGAALFPLGEMTKGDVYALAREWALPVARKPESQDLCFIPGGDVRAFLRERLGEGKEGEIVDRAGRILGRHGGIHDFTIGQRRGLRIASPRPLYVIAIDAPSNRVIVGEEEEQFGRLLLAAGCRLHDPDVWQGPFRADVRIRSRHDPSIATVTPVSVERAHVRFDEPQRAITPGQAVVFYEGDLVLGGGWIESGPLDMGLGNPVRSPSSIAERA